MLFDVKKFQRAYSRGYIPSKPVKTIILRLLQMYSLSSGRLIKWNFPNQVCLL